MGEKKFLHFNVITTSNKLFDCIRDIIDGKIDEKLKKMEKNEIKIEKKRLATEKARMGRDSTVPVMMKNHLADPLANSFLLILFQNKRFLKAVMQFRPDYEKITQANILVHDVIKDMKAEMGLLSSEEEDEPLLVEIPKEEPFDIKKAVNPRERILRGKVKKPKKLENKRQKLRRHGVRLILCLQKLFAYMLKGDNFMLDTTEVLENIVDIHTFEVYRYKKDPVRRPEKFYHYFMETVKAGFETDKNVINSFYFCCII
jgi:hypothetical protein